MQRVIHLKPGEARCYGSRCGRRQQCALNLAAPEQGRPAGDYSGDIGWRERDCAHFVTPDARRPPSGGGRAPGARMPGGSAISNPAIALERLDAASYQGARERTDCCARCSHSRVVMYERIKSSTGASLHCDLHKARVSAGGICDEHKPERQSALIAPRLADQLAGCGAGA